MSFVRFPFELFELRDVAAMAVMLRVIMRMDANGNGVCFESRASMCENLGIDKNTWKKKIALLEEKGMIEVSRHPNIPHHMTLTDKVKVYMGVKNHPLTIFNNMDLDRGRNFTPSDAKPQKKRVSRRRRSTNKIPSDPPLSELDAIHRKHLKKIEKAKKSEEEAP